MARFIGTCTTCFQPVELTPEEADALIDSKGWLTCKQCKPFADLLDRLSNLAAEREARRLWAAMMLARDVKTLESIRRGRPVHRLRLDRKTLARAVRGTPLTATDWIQVTPEMLDAIDEAGPFR